MAILDDLHEIAPLGGGQPLRSPVVEDQQIGFHEGAEQTGVPPVASGEFQFGEETWGPPVEDGGVVAAGLLTKGTGKPGLAKSTQANDRLPAFRILRYGFVIRFILGRGSWCRLSRIRVTVGPRI